MTTSDDLEQCSVQSRAGLICTKDTGHKGDHCADDPEIGITWDRWKNNNQGAN